MRYGTNKYGAKKTEVDGIVFDSMKEATRWTELKLMERQGLIKELKRQVRVELIPKTDKYRAVTYVADFQYRDVKTGLVQYEDVKGCKQGEAYRMFVLKKKLMYWRWGKDIIEI